MHHTMRKKNRRESAAAIRAKNGIWRATMRREAGEHENFFIAKNRDSESTQQAFRAAVELRRHRLRGDR
jgi:hypothetical protein